MTCIVAIEHNGEIYIGGDSAGVAGYDLTIRADKKVFKNGEMVMGFTSSFRMGQLLQFSLTLPYHKPDMDDYRYMCTAFVDAVRTCLKEGGFARIESGEDKGGTFIVGYRGKIYTIESDFQVGMPIANFASVGCGEDIAHGSLYSTRDEPDPRKRVLEALAAAETYSAGVRAPFNVITTTDKA